MRTMPLWIVAAIALSPTVTSSAHATDPHCPAIWLKGQEADAETIKRLEVAWLTAEYRGDTAFLGCLLSDGYRVISSRTEVTHSREDLLASFEKNRGSTRDVPPLKTRVVVNGRYATAYSTMTGHKQTGEPFEASFVDNYVFSGDHWEAVGGVDL